MKEDEWLCCCLEAVSDSKTLDILKKGNELEGKLGPQFLPRISFLTPHNCGPLPYHTKNQPVIAWEQGGVESPFTLPH